ncbi:hypothetical protein B0H19DRAFT_1261230 [Mycena capillaripes]|nr:hypothetical protein B0H19DRAFT_1261230 [Mycena capillaripes]
MPQSQSVFHLPEITGSDEAADILKFGVFETVKDIPPEIVFVAEFNDDHPRDFDLPTDGGCYRQCYKPRAFTVSTASTYSYGSVWIIRNAFHGTTHLDLIASHFVGHENPFSGHSGNYHRSLNS